MLGPVKNAGSSCRRSSPGTEKITRPTWFPLPSRSPLRTIAAPSNISFATRARDLQYSLTCTRPASVQPSTERRPCLWAGAAACGVGPADPGPTLPSLSRIPPRVCLGRVATAAPGSLRVLSPHWAVPSKKKNIISGEARPVSMIMRLNSSYYPLNILLHRTDTRRLT